MLIDQRQEENLVRDLAVTASVREYLSVFRKLGVEDWCAVNSRKKFVPGRSALAGYVRRECESNRNCAAGSDQEPPASHCPVQSYFPAFVAITLW